MHAEELPKGHLPIGEFYCVTRLTPEFFDPTSSLKRKETIRSQMPFLFKLIKKSVAIYDRARQFKRENSRMYLTNPATGLSDVEPRGQLLLGSALGDGGLSSEGMVIEAEGG